MNEPAAALDDALNQWLCGLTLQAPARPAQAAERLRRRWSWRLSLLLHGSVFAFALAAFLADVPLAAYSGSAEATSRPVGEFTDAAPVLVTIEGLQAARPTAAELAESEIARLAAELPPPELAAELLDPAAASTSAASGWLHRRVLDEVATAERLSQDDQRERLAALGGQLEQISSAESVDAISRRLSGFFGTAGRATQPANEPVPGEFDYDTAQLHDVKRTERADGGYDYVAVLLDAAGRTMESALAEAEGEQLYKTFQLIKANPLLERVYRGVVMSLFDKLMRQQPPVREERQE